MEKFEHQANRDAWAKELLAEKDKTKRREKWLALKQTDAYIDQEDFFSKEKKTEEIKKLAEYAATHFAEYANYANPEVEKLMLTIGENSDAYYDNVRPNAQEKVIERVKAFILNPTDEGLNKLLKQGNFDYEGVLTSDLEPEDKTEKILEMLFKIKSYGVAVIENIENEIEYNGFEEDPDTQDIKNYIEQAFDAEILNKVLISKITYHNDKVSIQVTGVDYMLPVDVYKEWVQKMPEASKYKFRAESYAMWNTSLDFSKKFIPTPINFFSFYGEKPGDLDYLKDVSEEDKMRLFKLGTISHEIGHHIYAYLADHDLRADWIKIVDQSKPITKYAKGYGSGSLNYDEFFAEAVRLKTTVPEYLKNNFPDVDKFLAEKFPEIK